MVSDAQIDEGLCQFLNHHYFRGFLAHLGENLMSAFGERVSSGGRSLALQDTFATFVYSAPAPEGGSASASSALGLVTPQLPVRSGSYASRVAATAACDAPRGWTVPNWCSSVLSVRWPSVQSVLWRRSARAAPTNAGRRSDVWIPRG